MNSPCFFLKIRNDTEEYQVYFGTTPHNAGKVLLDISEIHQSPDNHTDLALLKLARPVNSSSICIEVHSICLPAPHIIPTEPEYALTVGRGKKSDEIQWNRFAQIGYKKIITNHAGIPFDTDPQLQGYNTSNMLFTIPVDNQALTCKVNSIYSG